MLSFEFCLLNFHALFCFDRACGSSCKRYIGGDTCKVLFAEDCAHIMRHARHRSHSLQLLTVQIDRLGFVYRQNIIL